MHLFLLSAATSTRTPFFFFIDDIHVFPALPSSLTSQTIGPQCAGKTTFVNNLLPEGIEDIAIDDVPQSYEKVPLGTFLKQLGYDTEHSTVTELGVEYSDKKTYGMSVLTRISQIATEEQGILAVPFSGTRSFVDVRESLVAVLPEGDVAEMFLEVVEDIVCHYYTMVSN